MIKPDEILVFQDFLDYDEFYNLQCQKAKMSWQFQGRSSASMKEWHLNNPVYGGLKNPITDYTMLPEILRPPLIKLTNKYNVLINKECAYAALLIVGGGVFKLVCKLSDNENKLFDK